MKLLASLACHHGRRAAVLGCAIGGAALSWAALGAPFGGADVLTVAPASPPVRSLLLAVNQYRHQYGLVALRLAPHLELLALQHSNDMATLRRASHAGFGSRFEQADSDLCVENVASGFASADDAVRGWQASPPHDRNLLEPRLRWVGFASVGGYMTMFACEAAAVQARPLKGRAATSR